MSAYSSAIIYTSLFLGLYYQIFILVTLLEEEPEKNVGYRSDNRSSLPTVSIIVPCFNEEKTVERTVNSLLELNYPKEKISILIIDDGSKDSTYEKAVALTANKNVRAFTQKNGGKFTAMNFGIKNSQTEIVGCLDADSTVHPDALLKMIPHFNNKDVVAVTPAMKVHEAKTILQKVQNTEYNIGIFIKRIVGKLDAIHVTPGPFSLFKRDLFDKIGYFKHAHNTEDMEIAFRIQGNRGKIANCHSAFVYTITPPVLKKLIIQRTRWTYGFIRNAIDYRHFLLNPNYGNLGMLTLPFAIVSSIMAILLLTIFFYNIISNFIDFISKTLIVGFSPKLVFIDPFFINTSTSSIIALIVFSISLSFIIMSWRISKEKKGAIVDIVYFLLIYSFIAPIWLVKASFNVVTSRTTPWR